VESGGIDADRSSNFLISGNHSKERYVLIAAGILFFGQSTVLDFHVSPERISHASPGFPEFVGICAVRAGAHTCIDPSGRAGFHAGPSLARNQEIAGLRAQSSILGEPRPILQGMTDPPS
jgi:hypothetical protein